jgi:CheY-like chemotaxis protein
MTGTILIVEDETLAAMELQETLERMGHRVPETIASGDEVLAAVMRHRPDLVIMDIHLRSYIDGIDAVSRLRMVSSVPVIYVTAYPARSVLDRAMHTSPVDYLEKPIDDARLRESVERALSGRQAALA